MEKLREPKPADHVQCVRKVVVVNLRRFQSTTKQKLNVSQQAQSLGISPSVGVETLNDIFLILNAFSTSLPVPVGFVHLSLMVSLEKNQLLHNQPQ